MEGGGEPAEDAEDAVSEVISDEDGKEKDGRGMELEWDDIIDTAVVVPVNADELSPREEDLVGIETVGKFGDVAGVLVKTLVSG